MAISLSSRRVLIFAACILFSLARTASAAENDQPAFTFHSESNEVRLIFSAADRNQRGVATLRASDFVVVDSDVIVRTFGGFGHADWTKFEIGIIADNSESVAPRFRQELGQVVDLLSHTEPEENLSVFSFENSRPALLCAGHCGQSQVAQRLAQRPKGELTPLFDTIIFAADFLAQHGNPRAARILIVFSDGGDTFSDNTLVEAVRAALHDEVEIYCVDLNDSFSRRAAVLYQLSSATGGHYFRSHSGTTPVSNAMLEALQTTYTVIYSVPTHAMGFHSVRVMPTHDSHLQFRSRSGYFYPDNNR